MASRPDYLKSYDAQSFPYQMANNSPYVPPADYPMDELMLRPKRPRTPPMDYSSERYPFSTIVEGQSYKHPAEVVRTTAEALNPTPISQPNYPAPAVINKPATYRSVPGVIYRRHTTAPAPAGSDSPGLSANNRSSSGMNKAFLHHARNYDKFATIKGRGHCCSNCPICKAIAAANVALESEDTPSPGNTPPMVAARSLGQARDKNRSPAIQKNYSIPPPDFQDDDDDHEAYQKERRQQAFLRDLTKRGAHVARVIADRVSRNVRELTVTKGEYLEILDDSRRWYACSNVSGQLGHVPAAILVSVSYEEVAMAKASGNKN